MPVPNDNGLGMVGRDNTIALSSGYVRRDRKALETHPTLDLRSLVMNSDALAHKES
jgi:hypothetical protein